MQAFCIYLLYSFGVLSEIITCIDVLPDRTSKEGHKARVHIYLKERISHSGYINRGNFMKFKINYCYVYYSKA